MNIGSIFVSLGFKANTRPVVSFGKEIQSLQRGVSQLGIAFAGSLFAVKQFLSSGLEASNNLVNFNNQTGLAVDKLNQFAQAGRSLSASLDVGNITNDIISLEKSILRIRLGQGSIAPFQRLGIDVLEGNAFNVLEQLRSRVKDLSDPMATILLEDIGLNPNFLQILKLSRQEFDRLGKNNFLSDREARILNRLGLQTRGLTTEFINLKNKAIVQLAPYFTQLMNDTFKWLASNGGKIVSTISGITKEIGAFVTGLGRGIAFAGELLEKTLGIENGVKAVSIAVGLLLMPFKRILLPVFATLLVLESISFYLNGYQGPLTGFYDFVKMIHTEFIDMKLTIGLIIASIGGVMFALGSKVKGGALIGIGGLLGIEGLFDTVREDNTGKYSLPERFAVENFFDTINKNNTGKYSKMSFPEQFANEEVMKIAEKNEMQSGASPISTSKTINTIYKGEINMTGTITKTLSPQQLKKIEQAMWDAIDESADTNNKQSMGSMSSFI